eukprot:Gb_04014 [translate_table: standard]
MTTMYSAKEEFDFTELVREAPTRWLRPVEVLFILQNYQNFKLSPDPPNKPPSGSLFLFDRKILRFFRKDGHNWRKKKDGKTVREAHERLKAGSVDALHCYYAHGEDNPNFQRRSYWMLKESYEHIVLVHYREVSEGRVNNSSVPIFSKDGSLSGENQHFTITQVPYSSEATGIGGAQTASWISSSPGSGEEVSSNFVMANDELDSEDDIDKNEDFGNSLTHEVASSQHQETSLLQQLTQELNLDIDDSIYYPKNPSPSWSASSMGPVKSNLSNSENGSANCEILTPSAQISKYQEEYQHESETSVNPKNLNIDILLQNPDAYLGQWRLRPQKTGGNPWSWTGLREAESSSPSWKEMLELCTAPTKDNVLSSSFPKVQESNLSTVNPNKASNIVESLVEVNNVSPKSKIAGHQVSSEQNGPGRTNIKNILQEELMFSSRDEHNRWKQTTCLQRQWPEDTEIIENQTSECQQLYGNEGNYQYSTSTRHFTTGTSNSLISLTTMPFPEEHEGWESSPYLLTKNSSFQEEGIEKFKKLDSFGWLDDQEISTDKSNMQSDYCGVLFEQQSYMGVQQLQEDSTVTVSQVQRFSIHEFAPDWAYSTEGTKVLLCGNFIGNPSELNWHCMFGDIEVPADIIQQGVLCCKAPPHGPGKLSFCVTCGNREACSEIREFEYREKPCSYANERVLSSADAKKGHEEHLLQVRFARMLLSDRNCTSSLDFIQNESTSFKDAVSLLEAVSDDQWERIECAVGGGGEPLAYTKEWLLQTFLKEKLYQWLVCKTKEGEKGASVLNKHGQGVLHMAAVLGYEWALSPILNAGVGINFRDAHGWTALHWAAHYGREKTVAALIAVGASAGAVTDPTPKYPAGRTAADIAAASGHGGIAGYLAEASLTSHLSSLTLGESEISKVSAVVEADRAVESVSDRSSIQQTVGTTEDQLSLKDSLAAVRNAALAAARIQSAFRAHSFRRRQQKSEGICNEYGMTQADIHGISTVSKIQRALRNHRDQKLHTAATCIQRKFRGWKDRKEFLTLRRHVVRIQAHVRGHQVRKKYKPLLWTVGILDKAILRWRRKGAGLRGFRADLPEGIELDGKNDDDDDILKAFRKQKVNMALDEAVARVLHMVDSPEARHQYRRMLERYQQAKAEYHGHASDTSSSSHGDSRYIEDEYMNLLE